MESLAVAVVLILLIGAGGVRDYYFHKRVDLVSKQLKRETNYHSKNADYKPRTFTKLQ